MPAPSSRRPAGARQLALELRLRAGTTFDNYYAGPNADAVGALRGGERQVYLWGGAATGKTHLLQAACRARAGSQETCVYLPMASLIRGEVAWLEDLDATHLACLDELDAIVGEPAWEQAVFALINRARQHGCCLILASRDNPAHMPVVLADLRSRLLWGPVYKLRALDDTDKLALLRARARQLGLGLSRHAGGYLLRNYPRDLAVLLELLVRLDRASLAAQRKLTIPFIKSVLEEDP